jgi:hypothetical protein
MRYWIATVICAALAGYDSEIQAATKLSGALLAGGDVALFDVAPD